MTVKTESVVYFDGDTKLIGYTAFPENLSEATPVVMIAPTWEGVGEFIQERARAIAALGYIAFAVDIYGEGKVGTNIPENQALMKPFKDDRNLLRDRITAAYDFAKTLVHADASQVAAIGYCFGGLVVLDLARSGAAVKGVVSLHGLLDAPGIETPATITAKVLALHGHDDPMVPVEQVNAFQTEMTQAGADWQLHAYGNTMHAFTNPGANNPSFGAVYNKAADRRSWASMRAFLQEIFS